MIEGQYYIIDVGNGRTVVEKERWDRSIQQGATLTMSLVMSHLRRRASSCPRPSCPGGGFNQCPGPGLLSCKTCNLKFYPIWDKLENSSNRLEEEDQVAQRQNEEELRLYGSRPEPMDALEVDVDTQLVDLLTNDLTMDFKTALDEAENAHKETASNSDDENEDEANIYVDGNAGANPLSAWLTHSALPSVVPMQSHPLDQSIGTYFDLVEQEKKEIVVFRSVHLISNPESDGHVTEITEDKSVLDLELSLQIYYRNIVDRYPLLPTYLARRLAEANSIRAERLSHQRVEAAAKGKSTHAKLHGSNASGTTKCPDAGSVSEGTGQKAERNFEKVRCDLCTEVKTFSRRDALTRHKRVVHPDVNFPVTTRGGLEVEERVDETPKSVRKRASPYTSLSKGQPQSDYWSGETRHYRTESVGSHSSSMNSSLHGSPKFCYQKEYQNTDYFTSKSKYFYSSPSLAPPPVKLRKGRPSKRKAKKKSFRCDICGERVKVDGRHQRRQWQKHVMKDLRPYNCTALECDHTTESFPSLFRLLTHEIETHGLSPLERPSASTFSRRTQESISCIFYGERTENDRRRHLVHVGHHMEEIAFTVVAKANEEWEFYSESSFANSDSCKQTKAAVPKRNAAAADTDEK